MGIFKNIKSNLKERVELNREHQKLRKEVQAEIRQKALRERRKIYVKEAIKQARLKAKSDAKLKYGPKKKSTSTQQNNMSVGEYLNQF